VDKTPHRNTGRHTGESLGAPGARENAKLAPIRKQTLERIEAYFDKFGELNVIEM